MSNRYVLCTTSRHGVFAGRLESLDLVPRVDGDRAVLLDAQMCIRWSVETRGVLGLAATGPAPGSRVGPPVPRLEIAGVTAVVDMTDEAVERWRAQPWS